MTKGSRKIDAKIREAVAAGRRNGRLNGGSEDREVMRKYMSKSNKRCLDPKGSKGQMITEAEV